MKNSRTLKTIIAIVLLVVTLFTFGGCDIIMEYLGIENKLTITATYVGDPIEVGGTLDKNDIVVEATFVEGIAGTEVTYPVVDFTVSPLDSSTAGDKTLQVTYTEMGLTADATITVTVFVPVTFVGIQATYVGAPLQVGQTLSQSNFAVQEVYSDNSKVAVTNFTFSTVDTSTAGTKQVTISYQKDGTTYACQVDVTVVAEPVVLTGITALCQKEIWYVGDTLQTTDFVVTAQFSDHQSVVTDFTIVSPTGALETAGDVEVEIAYTYNDQTCYTTLSITVLQEEVANYGKYGILSADGESVKIVDTAKVIDTTDFQIHFLQLGNQYTGDSIYIKAGDTDILIDAGSRKSSAQTIGDYIDQFVTDGTLEYVIATHADQDHIAGFVGTTTAKGIFSRYVCENIIDFPLSSKTTQVSKDYKSNRDAEVAAGANHYTALECWNADNSATRFTQSVDATGARRYIKLSANVEMEILYNYYYEHTTSDENDYSVCLMFNQYGENYDFSNLSNPENEKNVNHFLFTGDLEESGEGYLVQYNDLPEVVLYKAGHHGSKTSSTAALLAAIKPKVVCVCCCTGSDEYTTANENQFPTQLMINRVAPYTDLVFATSLYSASSSTHTPLNGYITLTCNNLGINLTASNNVTLLKDTDWFKANRICPTQWQ